MHAGHVCHVYGSDLVLWRISRRGKREASKSILGEDDGRAGPRMVTRGGDTMEQAWLAAEIRSGIG